MRLGVVDIGSNTGHLLVVDTHGGAAPLPAFSYKHPLRIAEQLDHRGAVTDKGVDALTRFVARSLELAEDKGCEEVLGFATSALRDLVNSDEVLKIVHDKTGVDIGVLPGEDEARLTFLGPPLVRLVVRAAGRLRHRWRPRWRWRPGWTRRSAHGRCARASSSSVSTSSASSGNSLVG